MVAVRRISYRDALSILQGKDTRLGDRLDKLLGMAIVASIPFVGPVAAGLLGPKNELKKILEEPLGRISANIRGLRIADRTTRLEAAHCALVVTAVLEVSAEYLGNDWTALKLTDAELKYLLSVTDQLDNTHLKGLTRFISSTAFATPEPTEAFRRTVARVENFAARYADNLILFLESLTIWDETQQEQLRASLRPPEVGMGSVLKIHAAVIW